LTQQGITNPTPEQIQAALNGGSVTTSTGTTDLKGVLQLRSEGKGWGQIANSLGFKLGEVISASKTDKAGGVKSEKAAKTEKTEKAERAQKADRPEKAERPEKTERPEKVERPQKVERPEKAERPGK
jgi:uncharacterized protein YaiL (DUF2058 family)